MIRPDSNAPISEPDWVLLVDDDDNVRHVLTQQLELAGLDVAAAPSGREALELLRRRETRPLLALVDMLMPGMDGLTLARELTARLDGRTRIAIVTGQLDMERHWPKDLPRLECIAKPFRMTRLLELVHSARAERTNLPR